jgi:hypothetical protein
VTFKTVAISGGATWLLHALLLATVFSGGPEGPRDPDTLYAYLTYPEAVWVVLMFSAPVVALVGVPVAWAASAALGSSHPLLVHVLAWALVGFLASAFTTLVVGNLVVALAVVAAFSAAVGRSLGAWLPSLANRAREDRVPAR